MQKSHTGNSKLHPKTCSSSGVAAKARCQLYHVEHIPLGQGA